MKKILIDGDIGYDWQDSGVTAKSVQEQLKGIEAGEDIEVEINSPGGSVYDGVVIFNLIRDMAKTHSVSVRLNCIALSMGSYIALAARTVDLNAKVVATDNSVFMIHNPWGFSVGDYNQLRQDAEYFEKLSCMLSKVYSYVTGKADKDVKKAMDGETWYVGREIEEAGFANAFEEITPAKSKDGEGAAAYSAVRKSAIAAAKAQFEKMSEKTRAALAEHKQEMSGAMQKIAACANGFLSKGFDPYKAAFGSAGDNDKSQSAGAKAFGTGGGSMSPEELLAKDKACYEAVVALGKKDALAKERARVNALLDRGKKCNAQDIALKHVLDGKAASDDDVVDEFIQAATDKKREEDRISDNVPPVCTGAEQSFDTDEQEKAFAEGLRGGKYK